MVGAAETWVALGLAPPAEADADPLAAALLEAAPDAAVGPTALASPVAEGSGAGSEDPPQGQTADVNHQRQEERAALRGGWHQGSTAREDKNEAIGVPQQLPHSTLATLTIRQTVQDN